nr:MAG TPA: hypothetical protein [Caudoviricetes sp.]
MLKPFSRHSSVIDCVMEKDFEEEEPPNRKINL